MQQTPKLQNSIYFPCYFFFFNLYSQWHKLNRDVSELTIRYRRPFEGFESGVGVAMSRRYGYRGRKRVYGLAPSPPRDGGSCLWLGSGIFERHLRRAQLPQFCELTPTAGVVLERTHSIGSGKGSSANARDGNWRARDKQWMESDNVRAGEGSAIVESIEVGASWLWTSLRWRHFVVTSLFLNF